MSPTRKEIASWLREAENVSLGASNAYNSLGFYDVSNHFKKKREEFKERAAQVEQGGRCESCRWWPLTKKSTTIMECARMYLKNRDYVVEAEIVVGCGPQFGCIHHQEKK